MPESEHEERRRTDPIIEDGSRDVLYRGCKVSRGPFLSVLVAAKGKTGMVQDLVSI